MSTLSEFIASEYESACKVRSDINELLPAIRSICETVDHVTEFGTRTGRSLRAILAAQPMKIVSYDIAPTLPEVSFLTSNTGITSLELLHGPLTGNTIGCPVIERTNLLFVDTVHTESQVAQELKIHGHMVTDFIVFHDTHTFGERGDVKTISPKTYHRGINHAIRRWLISNPDWDTVFKTSKNNGLTVLQNSKSNIQWSCDCLKNEAR
jgi:hypothetical protein